MQEIEELQYIRGGQIPSLMRRDDRIKEIELSVLKRIFVRSNQSTLDSYDYVTKVAFKMRHYNLVNNANSDSE